MIKLQDYARVIRSKNSGPFELTFDILFANLEDYEYFVSSKVLTKESFAKLYQIDVNDIIAFEQIKAARGIKITIHDLGHKDQLEKVICMALNNTLIF